jgi:hypothetical protein
LHLPTSRSFTDNGRKFAGFGIWKLLLHISPADADQFVDRPADLPPSEQIELGKGWEIAEDFWKSIRGTPQLPNHRFVLNLSGILACKV